MQRAQKKTKWPLESFASRVIGSMEMLGCGGGRYFSVVSHGAAFADVNGQSAHIIVSGAGTV